MAEQQEQTPEQEPTNQPTDQFTLDKLGITQDQYNKLKQDDAPALKVVEELPSIDPRVFIPENPKVSMNSMKNLLPYQPAERQREIRERIGANSALKPLVNRRKQNQQELVNLIRKFKPHLTAAVQTAVKTMNGEGSEQVKLQAAKIVISEYRGLLKDLEAVSDEEEVEMIQAPRFSLVMVEDAKDSKNSEK